MDLESTVPKSYLEVMLPYLTPNSKLHIISITKRTAAMHSVLCSAHSSTLNKNKISYMECTDKQNILLPELSVNVGELQ